jgi:hypothetical protein
MRDGRWSVFLELRMEARKRVTNQDMEYWYMGSMEPKLEMQKKRMDECTATGVYLAHTDIGGRDKNARNSPPTVPFTIRQNTVTPCRGERGCGDWTCVPRACGVDLLLSLGRDLLLFLDLRGQNLGGVQDCTVGGRTRQ